jgi:hypothetical protein
MQSITVSYLAKTQEEPMKHVTLLTSIVALLLTATVLAQTPQGSGAKVFIDETTFDYGYLPGGEVVSHTYYLHSRGTDSLKILKVQPGCGCTKAPLKKEVVAVGDSSGVELVFTSSKGVKGNVSKSATVTCNDNDRGSFQLVFKGQSYDNPDSLTPLALSQPMIKLDSQSKNLETKLVVKNVSKSPLKVQLVSVPGEFVKVEAPNSEIKPGKEKEFKVTIDPSALNQSFKKSFTFAVNDQAATRYTVPVVFDKVIDPASISRAPERKTAGSH